MAKTLKELLLGRSPLFWAVVGFCVPIFWGVAFFVFFTVRSNTFAAVFYVLMYATCPTLLLVSDDIMLGLWMFTPFINGAVYFLLASIVQRIVHGRDLSPSIVSGE